MLEKVSEKMLMDSAERWVNQLGYLNSSLKRLLDEQVRFERSLCVEVEKVAGSYGKILSGQNEVAASVVTSLESVRVCVNVSMKAVNNRLGKLENKLSGIENSIAQFKGVTEHRNE